MHFLVFPEGAESSHMHEEDSLSFNRGYEWWMMAEAKKVEFQFKISYSPAYDYWNSFFQRNPNMRFYGLPWNFPGWIGQGTFSPYTNRTKLVEYIMNWIQGAKDVHGLDIDYIGVRCDLIFKNTS